MLACAFSTRQETSQGLGIDFDSPHVSDNNGTQTVEGDLSLAPGHKDHRPMRGLFANSKISKKKIDAERENNAESSRLAKRIGL
jgi:hypothetical protein